MRNLPELGPRERLRKASDASMKKKRTREDANGQGTGTDVVLGGVWRSGGD